MSNVPLSFLLLFPPTWLCCIALLCLYMFRLLDCAFVYFFVLFIQQLSPTIQGSEPDHEAGLEQTLFDRLMKMVSFIKPILIVWFNTDIHLQKKKIISIPLYHEATK